MHGYRRSVLFAAFWSLAFATLVLSLLPVTVPMPSTGWDKANHALGFAVLGWLGLRCWPGSPWRLLGALVVYGACIEVAQGFTATRRGEWLDLLADVLGLALGWAAWRWRAR